MNELTASFLAETAIKVETTRLETEHEWQEKLEAAKQNYEEELQTMTGKLLQVSRHLMMLESKYYLHFIWICNVREMDRHARFSLYEVRDNQGKRFLSI